MKKIFSTFAFAAMAAGAIQAANPSDLLIYINPGHGGHDADDRNVVVAPYTSGDPNGYWESNSNLDKGLALRDLLMAQGYKVMMSRVTNTSADDISITTIGRMASNANADLFFSIHSNATGTTARRNFPLMLYRGYDNAPVKPNDKVLCELLNKRLLENQATYWTSTNLNIRGDWSFYTNWGDKVGLGVLRYLTVIGMLSEGSFHDYIPETYRLLNKDFCWLEAWHFYKTVNDYFGNPGVGYGVVAGRLNDKRLPREGDYAMFGEDKFATIQGATVQLINAEGKVVDTYTTEEKHINGVFLFKNVAPGHYTVKASAPDYYDEQTEVDVAANQDVYANMKMNRVRSTAPEVVAYSPVWSDSDAPVPCNTPVSFTFNWDMDTEATEKAFTITPAVKGTITWEDLNYRMVFTPDDPYEVNTVYTVSLSTDAKHPGEMNLQAPVTFKFKTAAQNYVTILGNFPHDNEAIHYHDAWVEFRFNNLINSSTVLPHISCVDSKGNSVSFNKRQMKVSTNKSAYGFFRMPFTNDLTIGETYNLKIDKDFCDRNGLTLKEGVDIHFTVNDAGTPKTGVELIDDMDNASVYSFDEVASLNVTSNSVATNTSNKLAGNASVSFSYAFPELEGSEVCWKRSENAPVEVTSADRIGVHVNGDLTDNELYLQFTSETDVQYVKVCRLDFLGWRYIETVPATLEGSKPYMLSGIKVVQTGGQISGEGTIIVDDIYKKEDAGVADAMIATGVTVYPNPASDFIIANAGSLISDVELTAINGYTIARAQGNVLNVSDVPEGTYLFTVRIANAASTHKIIIKR